MYVVPTCMVFLIKKMWQWGLCVPVGEKKGIDVSDMAGVDFAAFKETQYNILASELRRTSGYETDL